MLSICEMMAHQHFLKGLVIVGCLIPFKLFAQNQEIFAVCQSDPSAQESIQDELLQLQEQLQNSSRSPHIHYQMGLAYQQLNQIEQAKKSFYQALACSDDPQLNSKVLYNVGKLNVCKQDFDEAIANYREALKQNPNDFDTKYNLALAHLMKKKSQQNQDQKKQNSQQNQNPNQKQDQQNQQQNSQQNQNQQQAQKEDHQNSEPNNPQEQSTQENQDKQENSQKSNQNLAQRSEQSQSQPDQEPFSLSKLQVEQALNSVQENRKGFVRRMLQQQFSNQAAPEKNW